MEDSERGIAISDEQARAAFAPLGRFSRILIAVSGGPDSVALMGLAASVLAPGRAVQVATVNHGLRSAAQTECDAVRRLARKLGLPWAQLDWTGDKPGTGIQNAAREARYRLLAVHALQIDAACVVTAHHRDDQAETVFMRLAAGSGIGGLAGMAVESRMADGLPLIRPLLGFSKNALVATCEARGWPYATDPSNSDAAFARSRTRALLPVLAAEGLSANRLCKLAERAARAEAALEAIVDDAMHAIPSFADGHSIAAGLLLDRPHEIGLRMLDHLLQRVGVEQGLEVREKRLEELERLFAALQAAYRDRERLARTLRGVLIRLTAAGMLRLTPAPPRAVKPDGANPAKIGS